MKNLSIFFALTLLLSQCGPAQEEGLAEKKAKLQELKSSYKELDAEIKSLEKEIKALDTSQAKSGTLVSVKSLKLEPFNHYATVEGVVESKTNVLIASEYQGQITSIKVEEGQKVRKGQLLATLNNQVIQSQLNELRTRYELAKELFERQERLWKKDKIGSELQYLESKNNKEALEQNIKALEAQLELTFIRAPHSGSIDEIFLKEGSFASPQAPFAQLVGLENLYIRAELSESYLPKVSVGDTALIEFPDLGIDEKGKIKRIGSVINPQNRSFSVDVSINNTSGLLRPNALATLTFNDYKNKKAMVLPSNAVQQDANGYYVFVVKDAEESKMAEKVYVETGLSNNQNQTEILSGLSLGSEVVVQGYNQISNQVPVEVR